jgi:hypothetical protein
MDTSDRTDSLKRPPRWGMAEKAIGSVVVIGGIIAGLMQVSPWETKVSHSAEIRALTREIDVLTARIIDHETRIRELERTVWRNKIHGGP